MLKDTSKILIIDDMATMRTIVKQTVTSLGFKNVEVAKDGEQAWQILEKSSVITSDVALILSDWDMPGSIDGLELLKKVRGASNLKHIPFVMLTSKSDAVDIELAKKAGANGYLTKPFSPADLKLALAAILKNA